MFGKGFRLFTIWDFPVRIDLSWFAILLVITWSLAAGYFPILFEGLPISAYWGLGLVGALGLFASLVVHELSHSLVARRYDMPITGITLFLFGGVSELTEEPPTPKAEFLVAIAGPGSSVALGIMFMLAAWGATSAGISPPLVGLVAYLGLINFVLAIFNMVPGFPLDGGRVLRAALWGWKKDQRWATKIASAVGSGFGVFLVALGVLNFLSGFVVAGLWWALIGLFLRSAAGSAYKQLMVRDSLKGETVGRFVKPDSLHVRPTTTIADLVENYIYKHQINDFPVEEDGHLIGCIGISQVKSIPREEWSSRLVGDVLDRCPAEISVRPEEDAMAALLKMSRNQLNRLLVVDDSGRLAGIVTMKDVTDFISIKFELGG